MSAEQDQRPKSAASSKKSEDQQRGHQLTDDGPVAASGGQQDAYQQLSDDQPEGTGADGEQQQGGKADKPKKENPLKKFMASLKSLNCTGKPGGKSGKNGEKNGSQEDDDNTPNARPVSQSSLESKKVVTDKNAPQIDVSPAVEDNHKEESKEEDEKKEEDNEKIASPVDAAHPPALTTTAISATPPTL
ncbi:hypothetical protein N0V85_009210 [Neurospora sp. IMI 360204]|nr:hypothetical protein N0V85_009210 [Neurospora sp. IMI 360204]